MSSFKQFFELSSLQLKFLLALASICLIASSILLVRSYSTSDNSPDPFPILLSQSTGHYTGTFQLDPNTAPADSLELIPGIGKVYADRIVAYRQHSRFKEAIDITNIKGIGARTWEKIKPYLKVKR